MTYCKEKSTPFFSQSELAFLDPTKIPKHIAIMPDGNRRWAKRHSKGISDGYAQGADVLLTTIRAAKELGIHVLTIYSFSTENWKRPKYETTTLMHFIETYLSDNRQNLIESDIRLHTIGNLQELPKSLFDLIARVKKETEKCTSLNLVLALNYGGRDELVRTIQYIAQECVKGNIKPHDITEQMISSHLDTGAWPDPDLIIRTSGEKRMSNFLIWQSSYTEFYSENDLWPQFTPKKLLAAILSYQNRDRRLGKGSST